MNSFLSQKPCPWNETQNNEREKVAYAALLLLWGQQLQKQPIIVVPCVVHSRPARAIGRVSNTIEHLQDNFVASKMEIGGSLGVYLIFFVEL